MKILFYTIHIYTHFWNSAFSNQATVTTTCQKWMNSCSVMEHTHARIRTLVCTLARPGSQPILRLIHNSSTCQSQAMKGYLLLLLEQYIKTQKARHLLPLSLRILSFSATPSLYPLFFFFLFFSHLHLLFYPLPPFSICPFPPSPLSFAAYFVVAVIFFHPLIHWMPGFKGWVWVSECASAYMSHPPTLHTPRAHFLCFSNNHTEACVRYLQLQYKDIQGFLFTVE